MPPHNKIDAIKTNNDIGNKNDLKTNNNTSNDKFTVTKIPEHNVKVVQTASVIVPPDGGWGWVVMVASFFCNFIVDGIVFSAGSILKPMQEDLNISTTMAGVVVSLLQGFYLIVGPFVSAMANRYGFRPTTIVGAVIASGAFMASYFATGVTYMCISYGIIAGIGFCMIYIPAVLSVGYYFERWRTLATGLSLCGSGVGAFILSPLTEMLVVNYGWRMTLGIQGGIILVCILCGAMFRPLKPVNVTVEDEPKIVAENKLPAGFTDTRYAYSVPSSVHNTWIGASSNTQYPTAHELFHPNERRQSGSGGVALATLNTNKKLEHLGKIQKRLSGQSTPEEIVTTPPIYPITIATELKTVGEDEEENEQETLLSGNGGGEKGEIKPIIMTGRRHTLSEKRPEGVRSRGSRRGSGVIGESRPLYRDDILYTGSVDRLSQYKSTTSLGYHMSVTRLPNTQDIEDDEEGTCKICPEAVRRVLATMLDMSLLRSPSFMMLATSGFLTMMGFFVPFNFIKDFAVESGTELSSAKFIVSAIGISNTVARICCGLLGSSKNIQALHLNNVAITAGGIATILVPYINFFAYAPVFGVAIACFSALRSIIAVDLMGLEKLTNAFGILMLFQGTAAAIGTPIAAAFYNVTQDYAYTFYFAGVLITISAILCYPINWVNKWEKRRAEENLKKKSNA